MKKSKGAAFSKKKRSGSRRLFSAVWSLIFFLAAAAVGCSYIPQKWLPERLIPASDAVITARNGIIAKTGLPVSQYKDMEKVKTDGGPEISVYFAPSANITKGLCEFMDQASSSLYVCIYDLDLASAADTMIEKRRKGVDVQLVVDSDNRKLAAVDRIHAAGIPVYEDNRPSLMHNKFVVRDASAVWTGSFNFTINGEKKNDNNALILQSPEAASLYIRKFREYTSGRFGRAASNRTVNGRFYAGKVPAEVMFSPADGVRMRLMEHLSCARKNVKVMAFSFTSDTMASMLGRLAKKGVTVQCVFDRGQAGSRFSRDEYLRGCGVQMRLSTNRTGKMHHKVIIIDDETVITGSYNFTENAERHNDENVMIIKDRNLAACYGREFNRCFKGTKGY